MQVVLVMFRPDGERRSFSVVRDMTIIGRREDCDLRIPLGDISRKHCRLIKDGDVIRVEDLGSSNGTYRNGTRVQQSELTAGDTLQVGPVVFVLQVDGVPADEDLQPVTGAAAAGGAAAGDDDLEVLDEAGGGGGGAKEFDPLEALNAEDEGSGFEFQLEEAEAAEAAARAQSSESADDDLIDMGDAAATEEAPVEELEEAPAELDEEPVALDDEAPVDLEEASEELDEIVDLEESENGKKS
jgi:pSer/pThr/pTyr-binding forkhead associated (FHA) protein